MYAVYGGRTERAVEALLRARKQEEISLRRMREEQRAEMEQMTRELRRQKLGIKAIVDAELSKFQRAVDDAPKPIFKHSYKRIEARAMKLFKVSRAEILSDRRAKEIVFARQFIVYWTCRLTRRSLPEIGRLMNRDHTTCMSSKRAYPRKRAKMGRTLRPIL
jgi:chromosomal replication initiation ATPase DnaA